MFSLTTVWTIPVFYKLQIKNSNITKSGFLWLNKKTGYIVKF